MAYGTPDYNAYKVVVRSTELTVPAGTGSGSPASTTVDLDKGELRRVDIGFAPGCVGLVKIRIKQGSSFVVPTEDAEWVAWDRVLLRFPIRWGVTADSTTFTVQGYSDDDTFDHAIRIHFVERVAR